MPKKITALKISEGSLVDRPANPGARMLFWKRAEDEDIALEAKTFAEAKVDRLVEEQLNSAMDGLYRNLWALRESLESIMEDEAVTDKVSAFSESTRQFLDAMAASVPVLVTKRVSFDGTSIASWEAVPKTFATYAAAYARAHGGEKVGGWADAPRSMKSWIAGKFLVGDSSAATFEDLKFPVVAPNGKLYAGALRSVMSGRGAQASLPPATVERARATARTLLSRHFGSPKVEKTMPEIDDRIAELEGQIGDLTKANADLTAKLETKAADDASKLQKELADAKAAAEALKAELAKAKGEEPAKKIELKGLPLEVQQALQDLEDLKKRAAERDAVFAKREEEIEIAKMEGEIDKRWTGMPLKPVVVAPVFRKIRQTITPDEWKGVIEKIMDSYAAMAVSLTKQTGSNAWSSESDAWGEIQAKARALAAADPNLNETAAIDKVLASPEGKELYKRYRQEQAN